MELTIKIKIKKSNVGSIEIDREVRMLLRDNLELAVQNTIDGVASDYGYETDLINLEITN